MFEVPDPMAGTIVGETARKNPVGGVSGGKS